MMEKIKDNVFYMITEDQIKAIVNEAVEAYVSKTSGRKNLSLPTLTRKKTEAAQMLGVTRATIYKMIEDGRLKATSDGKRVVTGSIIEYLNAHGKGKAKDA